MMSLISQPVSHKIFMITKYNILLQIVQSKNQVFVMFMFSISAFAFCYSGKTCVLGIKISTEKDPFRDYDLYAGGEKQLHFIDEKVQGAGKRCKKHSE